MKTAQQIHQILDETAKDYRRYSHPDPLFFEGQKLASFYKSALLVLAAFDSEEKLKHHRLKINKKMESYENAVNQAKSESKSMKQQTQKIKELADIWKPGMLQEQAKILNFICE